MSCSRSYAALEMADCPPRAVPALDAHGTECVLDMGRCGSEIFQAVGRDHCRTYVCLEGGLCDVYECFEHRSQRVGNLGVYSMEWPVAVEWSRKETGSRSGIKSRIWCRLLLIKHESFVRNAALDFCDVDEAAVGEDYAYSSVMLRSVCIHSEAL